MGVFVGYQGAKSCTTGPQPGARALMSWFLGAYSGRGGKNLGIFNCRSVRGASTTSLHGEGRAVDFGINPHGAAYGDQLAELLRSRSAELGIQCIIWKRRIWSGSQPHAGWRPYSGVNPHLDHLHVELSWAAARDLTAARVAQILGAAPSAPAPAAPSAGSRWPTIRQGDRGPAVAMFQRFRGLKDDGIFGPKTRESAVGYQRMKGLTADGIVGPATWRATGL